MKSFVEFSKDLDPSVKNAIVNKLKRVLAENPCIINTTTPETITLEQVYTSLGHTSYKLNVLNEILKMIMYHATNRFAIPSEIAALKKLCEESIETHHKLINCLMHKKEKPES